MDETHLSTKYSNLVSDETHSSIINLEWVLYSSSFLYFGTKVVLPLKKLYFWLRTYPSFYLVYSLKTNSFRPFQVDEFCEIFNKNWTNSYSTSKWMYNKVGNLRRIQRQGATSRGVSRSAANPLIYQNKRARGLF